MSMFFAGMVPVAPPPPPNPPAPRVSGSIRPLMQPKGVADPGDFPDNEHGAAVREILQTTGDYWAKVDEETPLLELPPFTREEI